MPKITLRKENEILRAVREEVVINPMISLRRLQANLKQRGFVTYSGNPIEDQYLKKLIRKLNREAFAESDRQEIGERLANTRQRFSTMIEKLLKIAFWRIDYIREGFYIPEYRDQIKAMDSIAKMDLALLQAEMDAGIFERHLGKLDIEIARKQPIPDDRRDVIYQVFKNWGLIPKDAPQKNDTGNKTTEPCRTLMVIQQPGG
jgi:hypothetical protein